MNTRSASGNPRAWGSLALGLAAALWGGACVNDATPPPPPPPPPPQPLPTFTIGLSPAAVAFDDTAGTAAGPAYTVAVTNTGTGTVTGLAVGPIAYSAGAADWLTATLSGTQAPATLTLGAATDSLAPGSYTATVPVASTVATNSPQQLSVTLTLAAPPPPPPPPPPPSVSGTVIVAAGNLGRCTGDLQRAAAAVVAAAQPDYVFVLGDNVEPDSGTRIATLENFQTCYDPLWGQFRSITYAAVGNVEQDTVTSSPERGFARGADAYFGPERVGPPGRNYYSFDLGGWHVVVLNVIMGGPKAPVTYNNASEQIAWLRDDLDAHDDVQCTLAVWHDPMWIGSTATSSDSTFLVQEIRGVWMALYEYGADVVINGGAHIYERFAPMRYEGSYEYPDPLGLQYRADSAHGIRQFTSGLGGDGPTTTPAMKVVHPLSEYRSGGNGFLQLTLGDGEYGWEFLNTRWSRIDDRGRGVCH